MYTCWETKVNARPGNFGARIDYVVCSHEMNEWWDDSNIQEGLMGSDHCPVYGTFKEKVMIQGQEKHILDLVNPPGMFKNGVRKEEWSAMNLLPMSGKLIPEFDRRRNIKDMFTKKPSLSSVSSSGGVPPSNVNGRLLASSQSPKKSDIKPFPAPELAPPSSQSPAKANGLKRSASNGVAASTSKKSKSESNGASKGQKSLKGFFAMKPPTRSEDTTSAPSSPEKQETAQDEPIPPIPEPSPAKSTKSVEDEAASFETKKTWGKLFARPVAPKCEHDEPCKTMVTRKPGINCGRSFWMCNRPLGPSGKQERGTEWRCNTFIWASDWDARQDPG